MRAASAREEPYPITLPYNPSPPLVKLANSGGSLCTRVVSPGMGKKEPAYCLSTAAECQHPRPRPHTLLRGNADFIHRAPPAPSLRPPCAVVGMIINSALSFAVRMQTIMRGPLISGGAAIPLGCLRLAAWTQEPPAQNGSSVGVVPTFAHCKERGTFLRCEAPSHLEMHPHLHSYMGLSLSASVETA